MEGVKEKKTIILHTSNLLKENKELIDEYLSDIKCTNLTKSTVDNYHSCLKELSSFYTKSLLDFDISDLKKFKIHLEKKKNQYGKPISSSTISRYFTAVESFLEFLEFNDYVDKNPMPKFRHRYLTFFKDEFLDRSQ